jgi:hypothetical protein
MFSTTPRYTPSDAICSPLFPARRASRRNAGDGRYLCSLEVALFEFSEGRGGARLWGMAKHEFSIGVTEQSNIPVGARCVRCGEIVLYVNGGIPQEKQSEKCPGANVNQIDAPAPK